jgi:O-antigen ligase
VVARRPSTIALRRPTELLAAAAFGIAAATLKDPLLAVAALLVVAFVVWTAHRLLGALSLFVILTFVGELPTASIVSLVKVVGAVIVVVWIGGLVLRRRPVPVAIREQPVTCACAVGLVVWALVSIAWAADPATALSTAFRLGQGVVVVFVIAGCATDRRALRFLMMAFVAGATLSGLLGLLGVGGAVVADASGAVTTRLGGGLGDPNYLAAVLVPALVFALALGRTSARRRDQVALLLAALVMLLALVRTDSRGGLVALVATLVATAVAGGPLRRPLLGAATAALVVGAVVFVFFASSSSLSRLTSASDGGAGRTELWSVAGDVVRAHPILGVGSGNFPVVEATYAARTDANLTKPYLELTEGEVVHNTYLHVLAELGIVGLLLLATVIVGAIAAGHRACRILRDRGDAEGEVLTRALVLGAIGMFVAFVFLTAQYDKQLWIVIGFLLAAAGPASSAARLRVGGREA